MNHEVFRIVFILTEFLLKIRRKFAPQNSRMHAIARCIYVPILKLFSFGKRRRTKKILVNKHADLQQLSGLHCYRNSNVIIKRILLLTLAHMGDFIVSMRAIQRIRKSFPNAHITIVCGQWNADWAQRSGLCDKVVVFDFFTRLSIDWRGVVWPQYEKFAKLPLGTYDIAVDMRLGMDTRPCLYRTNATYRVGFFANKEAGYPYLDLVVPDSELIRSIHKTSTVHMEIMCDLIATAVISAFADKQEPHPALHLVASKQTITNNAYAVVALGAGYPIRNSWSLDKLAQVINTMIDTYNVDIYIVGGNAEKQKAEELLSKVNNARATLKINYSLAEMPTLIGNSSLFFGYDTGLSHLAAMLDVPSVVIFSGVENIDLWHPAGTRTTILKTAMPCAPCGLTTVEQCNFGVACLDKISPSDVLAAVQQLLAKDQHQENNTN